MLIIIGQFLTFLSYLIYWISRFYNKKKTLLIWDNTSRFVAIISFLALGTIDGIKNTIFVIFRNFMGIYLEKKPKKIKYIYFVILVIILTLLYSKSLLNLNLSNISSLCIYLSGIFNLIGAILCNTQGIRLFGIGGSLSYSLFMITTHNYTGFCCEFICLGVLITSYIKNKKKMSKGI
jgi:hypothetical protein